MWCLFLCTGLFPLALHLQASSLLCIAGFPSFLRVNNIPLDFPGGSVVKNLPLCRCSILGSGRPPGEGNGNPLQCSCLENPRDGGAWWAAVYGVSQSRTWLKWLSSSSSKPPLSHPSSFNSGLPVLCRDILVPPFLSLPCYTSSNPSCKFFPSPV